MQEGFVLNQEGVYNQEKLKKLEEIKNKLSQKSKGFQLNVEKVKLYVIQKIASDYFTQTEFKKMQIMPKPL